MGNEKNDFYYIEKIEEDLLFIEKHMRNEDQESFSCNEILQDSMMFRLIQISENAKKLSDDFKENHAIIPWMAIYGLRNRIVHDYGNVDLSIIYNTIKDDIPDLLQMLKDNRIV
jgi:uncharacterized protein with HEPN domain